MLNFLVEYLFTAAVHERFRFTNFGLIKSETELACRSLQLQSHPVLKRDNLINVTYNYLIKPLRNRNHCRIPKIASTPTYNT
jgi:hypothetical protein